MYAKRVAGRCPTSGKIRWASSLDAAVALGHARTSVNRSGPGAEQRSYLCPDCGSWHLTSKPPR